VPQESNAGVGRNRAPMAHKRDQPCLPNEWRSAARPGRSAATEGLVSCNVRVGLHPPSYCGPFDLAPLHGLNGRRLENVSFGENAMMSRSLSLVCSNRRLANSRWPSFNGSLRS
jgi:hypothetical protein